MKGCACPSQGSSTRSQPAPQSTRLGPTVPVPALPPRPLSPPQMHPFTLHDNGRGNCLRFLFIFHLKEKEISLFSLAELHLERARGSPFV